MAAPRKLPPEGAAEDIRRLAAEGYGQVGIAAHFNVSRDCLKRWINESEELNDAYEMGKESERQALHAMVVASARANKPANVNAFFLLKARHGYVETDNRTKVNVDVAVNSVLVVRDFGTDEEWAAKVAAQQRALTADSASPFQLEASTTPQVDAVTPHYGPPVFDWQSQPAPAPFHAQEPIPSALVARPAPPCEPPVWRGRA